MFSQCKTFHDGRERGSRIPKKRRNMTITSHTFKYRLRRDEVGDRVHENLGFIRAIMSTRHFLHVSDTPHKPSMQFRIEEIVQESQE